METSSPPNPDRPVAIWLLTLCGLLWVMIGLGGATRLTGSGLSIMEWQPIQGILPPLSAREWDRLYALYRQIPQYALVNDGFGLAGFKHIFWLEWVHRFWGRLIGVAFLLPLIVFVLRGRIGRRLLPRLVLLFVLGGLQGAVGWVMVASGFVADSTAVSPPLLVGHLSMALLLYTAILWTGLDLLRPDPIPMIRVPGTRRWTIAACLLLALTILAGGFVAGTHAGFAYNTFPLMGGQWVPADYAALPFPGNLVRNVAAVQFDHRVLATATLIACTAAALAAGRFRALRQRAMALGAAVALQYALGVTTLLLVVPVALGTLHQMMAVGVLTAALVLLHGVRPSRALIPIRRDLRYTATHSAGSPHVRLGND